MVGKYLVWIYAVNCFIFSFIHGQNYVLKFSFHSYEQIALDEQKNIYLVSPSKATLTKFFQHQNYDSSIVVGGKNLSLKDISLCLIKQLMSLENSEYQEVEEIEPFFVNNRRNKSKKTRFFINLGKKDNVTPYEIVELISKNTDIKPKTIGDIDIYDKFSFVEIYTDSEKLLLDKIDGLRYKRKKIGFEIANSRN